MVTIIIFGPHNVSKLKKKIPFSVSLGPQQLGEKDPLTQHIQTTGGAGTADTIRTHNM